MRRRPSPFPTAKQDRAAALLAAGSTVKAAAREVGSGERTLHDWLDVDAFRALVGRYRSRILNESLGKLAGFASAAVEALGEALFSSESDNVKVRAALGILDQLMRIRDAVDLEQRISEIEKRLPDGP